MLYTNKCLEEHERQQQNIGVWLSLARAPGLGPGGRRFESCHPDPFYGKLFYTMVGIAQLVSAPDCGSGGLGFESLYPPLQVKSLRRWAIAKRLRHRTLTPAFVGPNPTSPVKYGVLAQSVEHLTFNQVVRGSNPRCLIKRNP